MSSSKATAPVHGGYPGGGNFTVTYNVASVGTAPITVANPVASTLEGVSSMSLSPAQTPEVLRIGDMIAGSYDITYTETDEFGQRLSAKFEPESNITGVEAMRLQMLLSYVTLVVAASMTQRMRDVKPITYIRKHGLERHFRFSQA